MKRLILMRHAKSDWSDLTASDHQRGLNARGTESAAAVGQWLRNEGLTPDHILCSDARRTQETLELLELPDVPKTITKRLYLAEMDVMARILQQQTADCVLMVAHNPGTAHLAERLLSNVPQQVEFGKFPTGGTLVIDFGINSWQALPMGSGQMLHFITPRTLIK